MSDEFMEDYKRDTTHAMAARIKTLEEALRALYGVCLDVPDFRPDCQVMRQAREALK